MTMKMLESGFYLHYKGGRYFVLGVGKHSETLEEFVIYRSISDNPKFWIRPLQMFTENVTHEDKEIPRFRYLGLTI